MAFAEVKSIFLLILGQFLKHNRSTEDIILIFDFEDALVKLDKMGYRLKSEPLAVLFGGYEATVFRLGKLAGVVVRNLEVDVSVACLASNRDLLFAACDFLAGIGGVFQQVAEHKRDGGFAKSDILREADEDVQGDAVLLCLLFKIIEYAVCLVIFAINDGNGIWQGA